jgi:hypothetical protein
LLKDSKLFLVGLSGESVSDDLLAASFLKGARLNEIIDAATAAATSHMQKMSKPLNSTIVESQELCSHWVMSEVLGAVPEEIPAAVNELSFFAVPEQPPHTEFDVAPSTNIPDLSFFGEEEIDAMYEGLLSMIEELQSAYAQLLRHLSTALVVSSQAEALLSKCFFMQHNLACQFDILGMNRCAHHSWIAVSRLAFFPPVCNHYHCQEASEEMSQQLKQLWASPPTMYELITTYQLHMTKQSLPLPKSVGRDPTS